MILEEAGYDAFNGDVGSYDSWYWGHPLMYQEKGLYLPYNKILKSILKVPVITEGRMDDPDRASDAIINGQTDFVALGRLYLRMPLFQIKLKPIKLRKFAHACPAKKDVWEDSKTLLRFPVQ